MLFQSNKYVLSIDGMKCSHCAQKVTEALEKVEGVKKVKVNLDKKEAVVSSKVELNLDALKEAATFEKFTCTDIKKAN